MIRPVILSGGAGTRMWPLSRPDMPKPFLALTGERTMFQLTAERFHDRPEASDPIVVAHQSHEAEIARQLSAIGVRAATTILEPVARNTAGAIALAALAADPDDLLLVMPSDHTIERPEVFREAVLCARAAAADDWLVTFGIEPTFPSTGYGYIRRGERIADRVFRAANFEEKPARSVAEAYLAAGDSYWNAGIFLFRAGAMIATLDRHEPAVLEAARTAIAAGSSSDGVIRPDADAFARAPSISIDHAVIERADRVAVVPIDAGWSDVGSWDSLYGLLAKDGAGNAVVGEVLLEDVSGSLVIGEGITVAALGVTDLAIVATRDAVLIVPRDRAEEVKKLVNALKRRKSPAVS